MRSLLRRSEGEPRHLELPLERYRPIRRERPRPAPQPDEELTSAERSHLRRLRAQGLIRERRLTDGCPALARVVRWYELHRPALVSWGLSLAFAGCVAETWRVHGLGWALAMTGASAFILGAAWMVHLFRTAPDLDELRAERHRP